MSSYWIKTNRFIKKKFRNYVWDIPNSENKIYLTFDDGPTPEITEWVLRELEKHNAKATFFCIGHNIEKYPEIFEKLIVNGHSIGNHTFNHLNGWKTSTEEYLENSMQWSTVSGQSPTCNASPVRLGNYRGLGLQSAICNLFRPPYGKIKPSQSKKLRQLGYKIIMWDVLSADFGHVYFQRKMPRKCASKRDFRKYNRFSRQQKSISKFGIYFAKSLKILERKRICVRYN